MQTQKTFGGVFKSFKPPGLGNAGQVRKGKNQPKKRRAGSRILEWQPESGLISILRNSLVEAGAEGQKRVDQTELPTLMYFVRQMYPALGSSDREMIIKAILQLEFPEPQQAPHGAATEPTSAERLQTDEPFLTRLKDAALLEHANKLVKSKAFKSSAMPSRYDRLAELATTMKLDAWGELYSWERTDLIRAIVNAASPEVSFASGRRF